ncbi:MAG TPA: vitamin K epoxide reductase family protein [Candidatus Tectomicrobia bacterium]|nr:vitamin K epoxide reductase family protein [Candidatus Tectomicrobia bacterium]
MNRTRGIVALSLAGMAAMAAVSLLQTGIVRHLPDPPLPGFDSDRVNRSPIAYPLGIPDGTLSLASLALNVPAAAALGRRPRRWLATALAAKTAVEAAIAAWYAWQMPARERAWCGYCLVGAAAAGGIAALAIREARDTTAGADA